MADITIGVDISKEALDAYRFPSGESRRFDNTVKGHKALMRWIGSGVTRIVYEPTGAYHRRFECRLAEAGLPLVKVNPRQARRFAEATGKLAKTDRCDAAMLARMGAVLALTARPLGSALLNELKELHLARAALIAQRYRSDDPYAHQSRSRPCPALRHPDQHTRRLGCHRMRTHHRHAGTRNPRAATGRKPRRSRSGRPSVGQMDRPRLHSRRPGQCSPGPLHARPRRHALQPRPQGKIPGAKGGRKPAKVAITALMRKLIILANALLKAQRKWAPQTP